MDLSLFAHSPTNDRAFTVPEPPAAHTANESATHDTAEYTHPTREFYAPVAPLAPAPAPIIVEEQYAWKPLPPLPLGHSVERSLSPENLAESHSVY